MESSFSCRKLAAVFAHFLFDDADMLFRTSIVCPNIYRGRFRVSDSLFFPRWGFPFTKVDTLDRSPLKFFTTSSFHVKRIPHWGFSPVDGVHEEGGYIEDRAWSTCYVVYIICERIILINILYNDVEEANIQNGNKFSRILNVFSSSRLFWKFWT